MHTSFLCDDISTFVCETYSFTLREVWSPGLGDQPDHIRRPIQPEDHRRTAGDRHQAHSKQHRQEPLRG